MSTGDWSRTGIQAEVPVESDGYARGARRRFAVTLRQLVSPLPQPVLDLGPANALAREIERRHSVRVEHTGTHDLDRERLATICPGPYGTITAFEIFEHLMNPLFVLEGCREVLRPDGVLYLSVPRRQPHEWLFGKSPSISTSSRPTNCGGCWTKRASTSRTSRWRTHRSSAWECAPCCGVSSATCSSSAVSRTPAGRG